MREGELNDKFFNHPTGRWSKLAYKILHHPVFHVFDLLLSVALMLLALIEKPSVFGSQSDEQPLVSVSVCVCERERGGRGREIEREREIERDRERKSLFTCICALCMVSCN